MTDNRLEGIPNSPNNYNLVHKWTLGTLPKVKTLVW
jgi:hypothetical protein